MAFITGTLTSPRFPSGRYVHTDPLRREFGLRLLTEPLPEPLRSSLIRAWRRPARFDGNQAIQSAGARATNGSDDGCSRRAGTRRPQAPAAVGVHRQHPDAANLALMSTRWLSMMTLTELEVSRRVVETPRTEIKRETRNTQLRAQGASVRALCRAGCAAWRGGCPGRVPAVGRVGGLARKKKQALEAPASFCPGSQRVNSEVGEGNAGAGGFDIETNWACW